MARTSSVSQHRVVQLPRGYRFEGVLVLTWPWDRATPSRVGVCSPGDKRTSTDREANTYAKKRTHWQSVRAEKLSARWERREQVGDEESEEKKMRGCEGFGEVGSECGWGRRKRKKREAVDGQCVWGGDEEEERQGLQEAQGGGRGMR